MKRKKRITIKMVALGLAVAAFAAPAAQARLDEGLGVQIQSEPTFASGPDDRAVNFMSPAASNPLIVSPDDRAVNRTSSEPSQPVLVASDDGFEIGTLGMTGIVLLLGAGAAYWAVHEARKGKLASV